MQRRVLIPIVIAVATAALIGALWFAFFRSSTSPAPQSGTFGTGTTRTGGTAGNGTGGNGSNSIPGNGQNAAEGGIGSGTGGIIGGTGNLSGTSTGFSYEGGGEWLSGGGTGFNFNAGSGSTFTPNPANELNTGDNGGQVSLIGSFGDDGSGSGGGSFLGPALIGVGVGTALCTAGFFTSTGAGLSADAATAASYAAGQTQGALAVPVSDKGAYALLGIQLGFNNRLKASDTFKADFLDCITRTIAKAALQQITASVVNWINSGFQGKPSFVQDYKQFFTNVADQAAGEYIKGSALSFLCSPFQLKVRIAIAQSYAQRNAQTCTLSGAITNIQNFANNFSSGGWSSLLQFTTVPTNNPYGAFAYGQIGLVTAQQTALGLKQQDLSLGQGFLSFQQPTNCTTVPVRQPSGEVQAHQECSGSKIVTPGTVIQNSLIGTENSTLNSLNLAKSFDEIINALISQLMLRTLYSGLGNLSDTGGYENNFLTPEQQQAQDAANQLMTGLQGLVTIAQQYGQVQQGDINDIQTLQQQISTLQNCWLVAASSTSLTEQQQQIAANNATQSENFLHSYDPQVAKYNDEITRANTAIAILQELQSRTLNVQSTADVDAITADLNAAQAAGKLLSQNDITTAQQDRTTLQAKLATDSTSVSSQLTQCYAFH